MSCFGKFTREASPEIEQEQPRRNVWEGDVTAVMLADLSDGRMSRVQNCIDPIRRSLTGVNFVPVVGPTVALGTVSKIIIQGRFDLIQLHNSLEQAVRGEVKIISANINIHRPQEDVEQNVNRHHNYQGY